MLKTNKIYGEPNISEFWFIVASDSASLSPTLHALQIKFTYLLTKVNFKTSFGSA